MAIIQDMTVSVESAIYGALKTVLQAICDQHGIVVDHVSVSWTDISVLGSRPRSVVSGISVQASQVYSDIPAPAGDRR